MRELINRFVEYCKIANVGDMNLIEAESVLTKIGDVSCFYFNCILFDFYLVCSHYLCY